MLSDVQMQRVNFFYHCSAPMIKKCYSCLAEFLRSTCALVSLTRRSVTDKKHSLSGAEIGCFEWTLSEQSSMKFQAANNVTWWSGRFCWPAGCLLLAAWCATQSAAAAAPLFNAPPIAAVDLLPGEVLLISTRAIGTVCQTQAMHRNLRCQRLTLDAHGKHVWQQDDWQRLLTPQTNLTTYVYVHGNRVSSGRDRSDGMQVYRSLRAHLPSQTPIRFIIWSWPASQIRGPVRDYLVKAQRTTPVAWQLAWFLDKLPPESPIALVGYSYGARVVSGAAHLLAGGQLGNLKLTTRTYPHRPPVRAALMAAAYDANWIQPGHFYSRCLKMTENLVLATNRLDPAMRFYHLSNGRGRMHALGRSGVHQPRSLGAAAQHLVRIDFAREVGRSHSLLDYLAADGKMRQLWQQLATSHRKELTTNNLTTAQIR